MPCVHAPCPEPTAIVVPTPTTHTMLVPHRYPSPHPPSSAPSPVPSSHVQLKQHAVTEGSELGVGGEGGLSPAQDPALSQRKPEAQQP